MMGKETVNEKRLKYRGEMIRRWWLIKFSISYNVNIDHIYLTYYRNKILIQI